MDGSTVEHASACTINCTAGWRETFLRTLAQTGNVSCAATAAGIKRRTAYDHRKNDAGFAALWDEAVEEAADGLEYEIRRRALEGELEPKMYKGRVVQVWVDLNGNLLADDVAAALRLSSPELVRRVPLMVRKYDASLLTLLLRGAKPQKYGKRADGDSDPGSSQGPDVLEIVTPLTRHRFDGADETANPPG
jgi:hypothetical protein